MSAEFHLPRVYPIVDATQFAAASNPRAEMVRFAEDLLNAGATLLQYRDKMQKSREFLQTAQALRQSTKGRAKLIINDRADICLASEADGVHLGQDDLSPTRVRCIFASVQQQASPTRGDGGTFLIGFSTHNLAQLAEANKMPVDYVAIGPVFATSAKANPDPVVGLEGVRRARAATARPLVAIGGITRQNCREVKQAGADSVAVITDLLGSPLKAFEEFFRILE